MLLHRLPHARHPASGKQEDGCSTRNYAPGRCETIPQYLAILPSWTCPFLLNRQLWLHGNAGHCWCGSESALACLWVH